MKFFLFFTNNFESPRPPSRTGPRVPEAPSEDQMGACFPGAVRKVAQDDVGRAGRDGVGPLDACVPFRRLLLAQPLSRALLRLAFLVQLTGTLAQPTHFDRFFAHSACAAAAPLQVRRRTLIVHVGARAGLGQARVQAHNTRIPCRRAHHSG